jgi:hypothetical protein
MGWPNGPQESDARHGVPRDLLDDYTAAMAERRRGFVLTSLLRQSRVVLDGSWRHTKQDRSSLADLHRCD